MNNMSLKTFAALLALLITLMLSAWAQANDKQDKAQFRVLGEYLYRVNQCPKPSYTTKTSGCKVEGIDCVRAYYHANIGQGESKCELKARMIKNMALRALK